MPSGRKRRLLLKRRSDADLLTKIVLPSLDKLSAQNSYCLLVLLVLSFLSPQKTKKKKKERKTDEGKGFTS